MTGHYLILDRDGVINEDSDDYIKSPDEWQPLPGSIEAIARLSQAGVRIVVATNQSGLGRGYFSDIDLANMHALMLALVEEAGGEIAGIFYCPHTPDQACDCRKPAIGLLRQIEAEFGLPVAGSYYVGDSGKDIDCALAAGCRPVLVTTGKGRQTALELSADKRLKTLIFADLADFSRHFLAEVPHNSLPGDTSP